jgi:hypothetical protein
MVSACDTLDAKLVPKMEISEPPAIGWPLVKLAPFKIPPLVTVGPWANPNPAQTNNSAAIRIRIKVLLPNYRRRTGPGQWMNRKHFVKNQRE